MTDTSSQQLEGCERWSRPGSGDRAASIPHAFYVWVLIATCVAGLLRFYDLGKHSVWIDELHSVMHAADTWKGRISKVLSYMPEKLALTLDGSLPPPERAREFEHWKALGVREEVFRLPAAIIGTLTIPALALAGRRILGWKPTVFMSLLLALAPWHVYMSCIARFYVTQFLFYNLALLLYLDGTRTGSRSRLAWAFFFVLLAFLVQQPALVIGLVFGADLVIGYIRRDPPRLGRTGWILGSLTAIACIGILARDAALPSSRWEPFFAQASQTPFVIITAFVWMMIPAIALLCCLSGFIMLRTRPGQAWYFGAAAVAPVVAMAVLAGFMYANVRYTFIAQLAWLAVGGYGLAAIHDALKPHFGRVLAATPAAVAITACAVQVAIFHTIGYGYETRWKDAVAYIDAHRAEGEPIVAAGWVGAIVKYYRGANDAINAGSNEDLKTKLEGVTGRAWIIDRAGPDGRLQFPWLESNASLRAQFSNRVWQPYSTVRVYTYEPTR